MTEIKLYGFYPDGHGALSFFVAAVSLQEAHAKVGEYVAKHKPLYDHEWPDKYEVTEVDPGVVLINNND